MATKLTITGGKGLRLTFDNGFAVSIQIGGGNYGDNYDFPIGPITRDNPLPWSGSAEVAILAPTGGLIFIGNPDDEYRDTVLGYVPIDQVLDIVAAVRAVEGDPSSDEINAAISEFWANHEDAADEIERLRDDVLPTLT